MPFKKHFRQNSTIWIISITVLAFALRIALLDKKIFSSSDETNFLLASFDACSVFFPKGFAEFIHSLYRLLNFAWGAITPLYQSIFLILYQFLHIPSNELTLTLPHAVLGALYVPLIFFISETYFDKLTAKIAVSFAALAPLFVQTSRYTAPTGLISGFLTSLLVLLWFEYILMGRHTSRRKEMLIGLVIALIFLSDNQFLAVFLLLPVMTIYCRRLRITSDKILPPYVMLPGIIVLIAFASCWFYAILTKGFCYGTSIGHLFERSAELLRPGFYIKNFLYAIRLSCGYPMAVLSIPTMVFGYYLVANNKRGGVVFLWFLIYSLPYLFIIKAPPSYRDYYHTWLIPLIILTSDLISGMIRYLSAKLNKSLWAGFIFITSIFLITFLSTLSAVFRVGPFNEPHYYGTVEDNSGIKTAGYYFRNNFPQENTILSDFGMPVIKYYFNRSPLGEKKFLWTSFYPSIEEKYAHIDEKSALADIIVLNYENYLKAGQNLSNRGFYAIGEVFSNQKPKIIILSRRKREYKRMDAEIYDRLFDREFGSLHSLYIPAYYEY